MWFQNLNYKVLSCLLLEYYTLDTRFGESGVEDLLEKHFVMLIKKKIISQEHDRHHLDSRG